MVTFNQLEDDTYLSKFATPEQSRCPRLSFRGIKTPLYRMCSQSVMENRPFGRLSCILEEEQSILDSLLLAQWEDRMWKGLFRYDVTTSETKVIDGRRKFLAQLNEGCSVGYLPKPEENNVCHQGVPFVYDWMKHQEELLFCIGSNEKAHSELIPSAAVPNGAMLIIMNATPVEYGHVFLVPRCSNSLSQFLDARSLEMVTRVAAEINNSSFGLFYDYSRPCASHLYFQSCYFPNPLPVELMPVDTFFCDGQKGIHISTVIDYPVKTLLFESDCKGKIMAEILAQICSHLQERNIPYNLLLSNCGTKIFLFLQLTTANSSTLSAWECGGYFLFSSRYEFDQTTEATVIKRLRSISLDDEGFQAVKQLCCSTARKFAI